MRKLLRCLLVSAVSFSAIGHAQHNDSIQQNVSTTQRGSSALSSSTDAKVTQSKLPIVGNATCASRTANYITHTLPQQCLRTDRVLANATQSSGLDPSFHADGPSISLIVSDSASTALSAGIAEASTIATATASHSHSSADGTASTHATSSAPLSGEETETDSPLDNAKFLSFEEWKKQAIAKYPEQGGNFRERTERQRPGINNALEGYGEDGEIELDFSGFGAASDHPKQQRPSTGEAKELPPAQSAPHSPTARSKDAGKTCKERTNYASFDCAATMLKNNPECKSASSVLVENKDSYMLNTCAAKNKFFIVELCDLILVDTVVLANYEFFSSIFRHFRVSVSDAYPVKMDKWIDLGTFEARNAREVQAFLIEHSRIWARYLRIEFLTHYGSEYYCPISLLRVHGTTMLEEIRAQDQSAANDNVDEATLEVEASVAPPIAEEPASPTKESSRETLQAVVTAISAVSDKLSSSSTVSPADVSSNVSISDREIHQPSEASQVQQIPPSALSSSEITSANTTSTCETLSNPTTDDTASLRKGNESQTTKSDSRSGGESITTTTGDAIESLRSDVATPESQANNSISQIDSSASSRPMEQSMNGTQTSTANASSISSNNLRPSTSVESLSALSSDSSSLPRITSSSSTVPPLPQPSTQESFFKSIYKRLQQLESNSTLSLQYIEEQSRILRDAFSKVEKRQISATTTFLTNLNDTVMNELRDFRKAYDQLWQSTVIELEGQREQYQREMLALSTRLTLVADELVWQKRMGIVQSTLLLLCLGLVLFSRGGNAGYLELPIMQQVMNRSTAALNRRGWDTPPASPSPENRSPVARFRRRLWRSVTEPEPSIGHALDDPMSGTDSRPQSKEGTEMDGPPLSLKVEPPTPPRRSESAEGTWNDTDDDGIDTFDGG